MTDKLLVTLPSNKIEIIPGKKSEIKAIIKNASDFTESYSITLDGIDPRWYTLSAASVSLSPGDTSELTLTIKPPLISSGEAERYTANLKVTSTRDSSITTTVSIEMPVGSLLDFDLQLTPKKQKGRKGSFTATIINKGDRPATYAIEGKDPYNACRFHFKQQTIDAQPGETVKVSLSVEPKEKPFRGSVEAYKFKVVVTPHGSLPYQSKRASGELIYKPVLRTMPAFLLVVAVILIASAINGLSSLFSNLVEGGPSTSYTLTMNMDGKGTFSGAGIYEEGTVVFISVNPDPEWEFIEWIGDTDAIANRFSSNAQLVVNENYILTAHLKPKLIPPTTIANVVLSPQSPATLNYGEWVTINFKYLTNVDYPDPNQYDVFILPRPLSNGSLTPGYLSGPSPIRAPWQSKGEGSFTINSQPGEVIVDQIRFQILEAGNRNVMYEFFFPVNYTFWQDDSLKYEE